MKKNCSKYRCFVVPGKQIRGLLSIAALFAFLLLCPGLVCAVMPVADASGTAPPMENTAKTQQPGAEAGAGVSPLAQNGDGMPQPGVDAGPENAVAFPGMTTASFGPSPVNAEGVIIVVACAAVLCAGLTFCVFYHRGRENF